MKTYQDFEKIGQTLEERGSFIKSAITEFQATPIYRMAMTADAYARRQNTTIVNYEKYLYTVKGNAVKDNISANHKCVSNFFYRFIRQEVEYLLSNGITWQYEDTEDKIGADFDDAIIALAKSALIHGVAFGFFNLDHIEVFDIYSKDGASFVPIYDENNGALVAGIRYWRIDEKKPLRATLYEADGYTEYAWDVNGGDVKELFPKRFYKLNISTTEIDGSVIYDGENYVSFPIVPLWGNEFKQSELVGMRGDIDAYDLIKSGFANDLDDCSQIYWTLENTGGMDDVNLTKFIERLKTVKAAVVDGDAGARAESHTVDIPYQSRDVYLSLIERQLYADAMALNVKDIAGGATTATQIRAAYEPLSEKADSLESEIRGFCMKILKLAGAKEDEAPTFTRSILINTAEEIDTVIKAEKFLPSDYITRKVLTILGDGDRADDVIKELTAEETKRFANISVEEEEEKLNG